MKIILLFSSLLTLSACTLPNGLRIDLNDNIKAALSGNINKPMRSCYMAEPIAGFNNTKRKANVCTEEELDRHVRPLFGTFEGTYVGNASGTIKIEIMDGGIIGGYITSNHKQYKLLGRSNLVTGPFKNYLQLSVYSIDKNRNFKFSGKLEKDGLLNTSWNGTASPKKGNQISKIQRGTLSLTKTAPYKKRKQVAQ